MSDWKKDLRDRFEDFREQEPEGLWSAIEAEIAPKKKALPLWWLAAVPAAAAVAALFLLPGRGVDTPASRTSESVVEVVADGHEPAVIPADSSATLQDILDDKRLLADIPVRPVRRPSDEMIPQEVISAPISPSESPEGEEAVATSPETPVSEELVSEQIVSEEVVSEEPIRERMETAGSKDDSRPAPGMPDPFAVVPPAAPVRAGGFSVSLARTSGASAFAVTQGYGSGPTPAKRAYAPGQPGDTRSLSRLLTANQPTTTEARHHLPVRFGLTFSYAFAGNWHVESGIILTNLHSDFISGTESVYTATSQRVDCFGIPLHLRYQFTKPGTLLGVYATAGGSWEKGYRWTQDHFSYIDGTQQDQTRDISCPDFIQWTADAGLGLQLRLDRRGSFSVFAEPGVAYHFRNGSEIRTVYSDKPLSPSLTLGLRMLINP